MDVQLVSLNNSNFDANSRNTVGYKIEKIINSAFCCESEPFCSLKPDHVQSGLSPGYYVGTLWGHPIRARFTRS